ncbi:alkaline phosphatase family protein [Actinospica sp.]|uniref:alkaline phosphatase family protein n=1 Tax=Actinospica sp. TaxID=1872142 RepID=UPI002C8F46F5|nr:alkaline phosphatase family protein [Actinospica sp.]HWG23452.1 alkaline phosphatase family protein [Actinospica sp.]
MAECEHPAAPPAFGEYYVQQLLSTLVSNPEVWARTAVIIVYDENGGFFDHVVPPTAPEGTAGEWLSTLPSAAGGVNGPIGLGFRTPAMVISPFTAGGFRYSGTLDHTSVLRLIETRFGVQAPNIGLAPPDGRRLHRRLQLRAGADDGVPEAAEHQNRQHFRGRGGGASGARGHARRRHPVPAADLELHARPGDHAGPSAGAVGL